MFNITVVTVAFFHTNVLFLRKTFKRLKNYKKQAFVWLVISLA